MIRHESENKTRLITQPVHAYLCGQLARLWQHTPIEPRDEMLFAAMQHDVGWLERDDLPQVNAKGQPRTFTELDLDNHFEVWERSIRRVAGVSRYAGLIVSLHCTNLYERRLHGGQDSPEDQAKIRTFVIKQHEFEENLKQALAAYYGNLVENAYLKHNREQLQAWDWMSLLLCMGAARSSHVVKIGADQYITLEMNDSGILFVSPWTFSLDSVDLHGEARWLNRQIFKHDAQLQQAYHAVPLQMQKFHIRGKPDDAV